MTVLHTCTTSHDHCPSQSLQAELGFAVTPSVGHGRPFADCVLSSQAKVWRTPVRRHQTWRGPCHPVPKWRPRVSGLPPVLHTGTGEWIFMVPVVWCNTNFVYRPIEMWVT
jgi:hypothetical protein